MISKPTVLILGAGASIHAGYPLGMALINDLCSNRGAVKEGGYPNGWTVEETDKLITRLSQAGYYSIDAFLETVPDLAEMGKFLLAREIKRHEYLDRLFPPNSSGWYQYLFNSILENNSPRGFELSQLSIITFNYDRSIEAYLHTTLKARFEMTDEEASNTISHVPIVHVHGSLGKYPEVPYTPNCDTNELFEISKQIQIIHEIKDQEDTFCNSEFEYAHSFLSNAERIFFLGFGYHQDNIRRFRFFLPENFKGREVLATTRGMGPIDLDSLKSRLEPLGFHASMFNGSPCDRFFSHVASLN